MLNLALADDLDTRFSVPVANADPLAVAPILRAEGVLLGLGDAGAHVGQLCDACYTTELLGTWTREREVLTLEQAVHKLTGEPAAFLGLADRGKSRSAAPPTSVCSIPRPSGRANYAACVTCLQVVSG